MAYWQQKLEMKFNKHKYLEKPKENQQKSLKMTTRF